jgi:hypothetical protein
MAGNKEGALKGAKTNKEKYGADFYKNIGSRSWTNPERSRKTGFALMSKEEHVEYSKKGGKKTKEDYQKKTTNLHQETSVSTEIS